MKRFIALLLSIVFMTSMFACNYNHFSFDHDADGNKYITKGEWAEILGTYFGMDSCLSDTPYFSDVTAANAIFPYVQSCTEWEIFDNSGDKFNPNDYATVEFIVDSAVKASEADYSTYSTTLEYAKSENIEIGKSSSYVTIPDAIQVVEWAFEVYENKEFTEYENVKYNDEIIPMADVSADDNGTIILNSNDGNVSEGDVIMTQGTEENPFGVARKVSAVTYAENGEVILETVEPDIGDIYEGLDFAYVGTVTDASTVKTAEGVVLEGVTPVSSGDIISNKSQATTLTYSLPTKDTAKAQQLASKGKNLSFSVKLSKGGKVTYSPAFNELKASIEKGDNSEAEKEAARKLLDKVGFLKPMGSGTSDLGIGDKTVKVEATDKYTAGWEIEGKLALKNFYIETELKTKKAFGIPYGIDSFEYEIHYEVESSLKFDGKLEEEIAIATLPIPLGGSGITIEVEIFAKASLNGDLEIVQSIANTSTVKYTDKNGYKKTQSSQCERGAELSVSFKVGFGGKATLKAVGIKLIDVKLDVGIGAETSFAKLTWVVRYEGELYKYSGNVARVSGAEQEIVFCMDGTIYFPTISLSIGTSNGTLANKLGIKFTWKIMDKSGATFKSQILSLHYEPSNGGFVDQCILDTLKVFEEDVTPNVVEKDDENQTDNKIDNKTGSDVMDISQYAVSLDVGESTKISVTTLPYGYTGFDVEWISEDTSIIEVSNIKSDEKLASCQITAVSPGIASITVNTSDGKHPLRCTVIVKENGDVEYTPFD